MALLAGCGSSSSSSTTAASTAAVTPTQSTATTTAAGEGLTVQTKQDKLGTILAAGPKQMTVYLFEADKGTPAAPSARTWAVRNAQTAANR